MAWSHGMVSAVLHDSENLRCSLGEPREDAMSRKYSRTIAAFAAATIVAGCHGGGPSPDVVLVSPDLVPVSIDDALGRIGFCQRSSAVPFTVTVKNQGNQEAPESIVQIEFFPGGSRIADVFGPGPNGSLPPGVAWDVQFLDAPLAACFNPDCDFRITVDSTGQIAESNEANNAADGRCIG